MNLLALKHCILKHEVEKPHGIDILRHLTVRHFEDWTHNLDYYNKMQTYLNNILILAVGRDRHVYFNWKTWKWSYTKQNEDDQHYTHSSGRCDSKGKLTIDIYNPGKITSKHTTPQHGAVFAIWIYFEEHPRDFHHPDRDMYFELDIFETEPSDTDRRVKGLIFTSFLGEQHEGSRLETVWFKKELKGIHYTELEWDGNGNFTWRLDGVVMKKKHIDLPPNIEPYVIYSLGTKQDVLSQGTVYWSIYTPMV